MPTDSIEQPQAMSEHVCSNTTVAGSISSDQLKLLAKMAIPVWIFDTDHSTVPWANPAGLEIWSAGSIEELAQRDMGKDMSPVVRRRLRQYQEDFHKGFSFSESWTLYPKGEPATYHCVFDGIMLTDGRMAMLVQALSRHQRENTETFRSVQALLHTTVMISLYNYDGELMYCNPAARTMLGGNCQSLPDHLYEPQDFAEILQRVQAHQECRLEKKVNTRFGLRWHEFNIQHSLDAITGEATLLISETDISERRLAEKRAYQLAYHDTLTQLPNRSLLMGRLSGAIKQACERHEKLAVMFLDLDQFKKINDSLGHAVGDRLLVAVAKRLQQCVKSTDIVSRLGGDEFIIVVSQLQDKQQIASIAERVLQSLAESIVIDEHSLYVTTSLGISIYPNDSQDADELLKNADLAMYAAKAAGRNTYQYYAAEMNDQMMFRLQMENDLHQALLYDQFELYYQPRVSLSSGKIVGAEALIRWQHPERGLLNPGEFIPIAEECGIINTIGEWVLRTAAADLARWQQCYAALNVSVNVSVTQITIDSLFDQVALILAETGANPDRLELEITESILMGNKDHIIYTLEQLHKLGVRLAVDDFGTGYSNLGYLKKYPIDCLKIDRSFIADPEDKAIAEMIITLGRMMNLIVIAEGVEERGQLDWLRTHNCDEYQGYYFSKPLPVQAFEALLQRFYYTPAQQCA